MVSLTCENILKFFPIVSAACFTVHTAANELERTGLVHASAIKLTALAGAVSGTFRGTLIGLTRPPPQVREFSRRRSSQGVAKGAPADRHGSPALRRSIELIDFCLSRI